MTVEQSAAVIADLRRARRKQRVAAIHWVDALYQVYVTGIVAVAHVVKPPVGANDRRAV